VSADPATMSATPVAATAGASSALHRARPARSASGAATASRSPTSSAALPTAAAAPSDRSRHPVSPVVRSWTTVRNPNATAKKTASSTSTATAMVT
jgi:hypothetical protein